jgi:uncharacterized repeat protein (TIGR01451 family)
MLISSIITMLVVSNAIIIFSINTRANGIPPWPSDTSWVLSDTDGNDQGSNQDYRDVNYSYYYINGNYLYFRLECFGYPDFNDSSQKARYKWYIDTSNPHDMQVKSNGSGNTLIGAEYLLFAEDSANSTSDGIVDVYLVESDNGTFPTGYGYITNPGPITNKSIANCNISGHFIDLYIHRGSIGEPQYAYFTWATDPGFPNIDSTNGEKSENFFYPSISKSDMSVVKDDDPDPVKPGDYLTYTLKVTNYGPHVAKYVNVTDVLPPEVTFISAVPEPEGFIGSTYWWTYSNFSVGENESKNITINVNVSNDASGNITNTANVYSSSYDFIPDNNEYSQNTTIDTMVSLTINIYGTGSGTVEVSPAGPYNYNDEITLWANASEGSTFTGFSGSLTGTTTPQVLTMNDDKTVNAEFTLKGPYTLSLNKNGTGSGTIESSLSGPFYYGDTVTIWANASVGSTFTGFSGNLSGTTTPQVLTMNDDKTVNAEFTLKGPYTLSLNKNGTGSGTIESNLSGPFYYGDTVTIWANATAGSTFTGFYGDLTGTTTPQIIDIIDNMTVTAEFTQDNYILDITIIGSGSVSKNPDNNSYIYDTKVELTATPSPGWRFDYWSGDLTGSSKTAIINMTDDKSVTAHFSKIQGGGVPPIDDDGDGDSLPTADAGGPYFGVPDEEIQFNGTKSHDNDEDGISIVTYDWKFSDEGEWYMNISATPVYLYDEPGVYNVTLRVYDDEGDSDINITTATIVQPNRPPLAPQITGPKNGTQNTTYKYFAESTDDDGDLLSYVFDWNDGTEDSTESIPAGTEGSADHVWYEAGIYTISVHAFDGELQSGSTELTVLIDVLYVKDIGYLIDNDSDGIYDNFFSNSTNNITSTKQRKDGRYLINDDDDGDWDWIYDPETDTLEPYTPPKEEGFNLLWLLILLFIVLILLIFLLAKRRKKKEDAPPSKS